MTQEEIRQYVDSKAMMELTIKQSNLTCDTYTKGFNDGFNLGIRVAVDKALKWIEETISVAYGYNSYEITEELLDMFKQAMEQ